MGINGVSMIFALASWLIQVLRCGNNSYIMLWQPFYLKQCMIPMLTQDETQHQWSLNNIWPCIMGNQGFAQLDELLTELLMAFLFKNTMYNRKNTDSIIINFADTTPSKMRL
jgi:hypothetical protein